MFSVPRFHFVTFQRPGKHACVQDARFARLISPVTLPFLVSLFRELLATVSAAVGDGSISCWCLSCRVCQDPRT